MISILTTLPVLAAALVYESGIASFVRQRIHGCDPRTIRATWSDVGIVSIHPPPEDMSDLYRFMPELTDDTYDSYGCVDRECGAYKTTICKFHARCNRFVLRVGAMTQYSTSLHFRDVYFKHSDDRWIGYTHEHTLRYVGIDAIHWSGRTYNQSWAVWDDVGREWVHTERALLECDVPSHALGCTDPAGWMDDDMYTCEYYGAFPDRCTRSTPCCSCIWDP